MYNSPGQSKGKEELTVERFDRLVAETGLGDFIDEYKKRGYDFICQTASSSSHTSIAEINEKRIWLSGKDLADDRDPPASEASRFIAIVVHEVAHFEALERGLDHHNEVLVWKIAREICPVPLPAEWARLRSYALTSYDLRTIGDVVNQQQAEIINDGLCPVCETDSLVSWVGADFLSKDRKTFYRPFLCRNCDVGFSHVFDMHDNKPQGQGLVEWNVPIE